METLQTTQVAPPPIWAAPVEPEKKRTAPVPRVPETIEETGISLSLIEQLVYKALHFRGDVLGRVLSSALVI
jgi:hypothetical protein